MSGYLEEKMYAQTPLNIAVVNRGNAAPKAQRNTVFTAKADAVYILAKHFNQGVESYRKRLTSMCPSCNSGGEISIRWFTGEGGLPRTKRTPS
jgi:hypothetical protein